MSVERCRLSTSSLLGAQPVRVELELQFTGGLMQRIIMTGLANPAVREARDRVRGCLESCELPIPKRSVLVNFAPADVPKTGNGFDLPLAIGLSVLAGVVDPASIRDRVFLGELALDGRVRPVRGALAMAVAAAERGERVMMLPLENAAQAQLVDRLAIEPVASLPDALEVLSGRAPARVRALAEPTDTSLELLDVRGQPTARRALEIAAAGRHNLLLRGPPGTGKTMLARRLPGLLPDLDETQALEATTLHGLALGALDHIVRRPPLRAPHHTISRAGLVGGGSPLRPGEISLAHHGVLFLDELPEFPRSLLEALRQPLESHDVTIARANHVSRFPAAIQLVAAMNPCPCGYRGHPRRGCGCSAHALSVYARRLSGPLLDRFDLRVDVPVPDPAHLLGPPDGESTAVVARRVAAARAVLDGSDIPPLPRGVRTHLEDVARRTSISGRAIARTSRVARTIAALDGRARVDVVDLDEALSYQAPAVSEPSDA